MASILDRYGIKEVADVTFYSINADGSRGAPALYLDTLKVSTIEQTAETADARGGKGNPKLITWDYGKEITVTIEDALFSSKSMAIMFGNGTVNFNNNATVTRTAVIRADADGYLPEYFVADVYNAATNSSVRSKIYVGTADNAPAGMVKFDSTKMTLVGLTLEDGTAVQPTTANDTFTLAEWQAYLKVGSNPTSLASAAGGKKLFVTYTIKAATKEIVISGDSFPGTYYVVGDTYARSDVDGSDQFFQFVIEKAKVTSENTITLEAEGDPSVFSMNLTVLRPESGEMMKLVQYDLI